MVSHREVVRDTAEFGLRRMVGAMAAILPLTALIQVLVNRGDYRHPAVAAGVWLAVFAAGGWLVPRMRRGGLTFGEAAAGILIAVAAVGVIGWEHRAHDPAESVDLAIFGTVWLLALVALSQPARVWAPGALTVYGVHAALLIGVAGTDPRSLAQLEAAGYILVAVLIAFAALQPTVAMHTSMTARRAALASRSEAERAAAAAVMADRQGRLALLEMEALPLLRGIADGTLDPAAGEVVRQCARHAADLRHSLTGRAPDAGGLLARLRPALRVAEARGALVNVQVIGDPGIPPPRVAEAVLATVDAVIGALPPQQVMLTVLGSADDTEVYVTFGEPLRETPDLAPFGQNLPAAALARRGDRPGCRPGMPGDQLAEGGARVTGVIDVAAVDDHPLVLDSMAGWVMGAEGGIRVVGTAPTVGDLLAGPGRAADVVLLDLDLDDGSTVERNVADILAAGPVVLVLSASDKPVAVRAAMRAGALGYVLKNEQTGQIRAAIKEVAAGRDWISPRLAYIFATDDAADRPALSHQEKRALQLYATGMPMKSVARKMTISDETVKQYLGRVREKYARAGRAAPTKLDLYHRAVEDGHLLPPP